MMEEVKEILHLIEKLPHMALWVLGGFALYKLITYASLVGSVTMIVRLAILKGFEAYINPRPRGYKIKERFIDEAAADKFDQLIAMMRRVGMSYIHESDVSEAIQALESYRKK